MYPHYVTENDALAIPTFDYSDAKQRNEAHAVMRRGSPCILKNTGIATETVAGKGRPRAGGLVGLWGGALERDSMKTREVSDPDDPDDPDLDPDVRFLREFAKCGDRDARKWRVMLSSATPRKRNRFFPIDSKNNAFGSHYRIRQPETTLTRLSAKEFVKCVESWRERGAYLEDEIVAFDETESVVPVEGGDGLGRTVVENVHWNALYALASAQRFGKLRSVIVGVGTKRSALPPHVPSTSGIEGSAARVPSTKTNEETRDAHAPETSTGAGLDPIPSRIVPDTHGLEISEFDLRAEESAREARRAYEDDSGFETLQVQIKGRRRVWVVGPEYTYRGMYPFPTAHPLDGRSMVDWSDVDYAKFPKAARVRGVAGTLGPGDCLYVPEFYWRHEHGLTKTHAHCQFRFARTGGSGNPNRQGLETRTSLPPNLSLGRPRTAAASVFFVGREVEKAMTAAEGAGNAKRWLEICARDEERAWCDLSETADAKRVWTFQKIREMIDRGLPPPKVSARAFREALDEEFGKCFDATRTRKPLVPHLSSALRNLPPEPSACLEAPAPLDSESNPNRIPAPPVTVSLAARATERDLRGRDRYQTFLLEVLDGRMEPTPWVDDEFVDPVFLSEAKARVRALEEAEAESAESAAEPKKKEKDPNVTKESRSILSAAPRNAGELDVRQLRVALPSGGTLTVAKKALPDDRTDAERSFPEMFVDGLVRKGWSETKHTPVSVLNPEHPLFVGKNQANSVRRAP